MSRCYEELKVSKVVSVRISVFWVLSKLVKLLMQSFHHVLYIIVYHHHQLMQYNLHCIPEILTVSTSLAASESPRLTPLAASNFRPQHFARLP
jgi:hypothetical protein